MPLGGLKKKPAKKARIAGFFCAVQPWQAGSNNPFILLHNCAMNLFAKNSFSFSAAQSAVSALAAVIAAACLALSLPAAAQPLMPDGPQLDLPRVRLTAGIHQLAAQVAKSPEQRSTGLMFRKEMPQGEGMIFVFEQASQQCFWMKNTLLPLTAAFVADDGTIVNLADMTPQSTDSHCSAKPVRYVLEMNRGWFAKKGIKAGAKLGGEMFGK